MTEEVSAQLFLKLQNSRLDWVLGESNSPRHPGEIEVIGWRWTYVDPDDLENPEDSVAARGFGSMPLGMMSEFGNARAVGLRGEGRGIGTLGALASMSGTSDDGIPAEAGSGPGNVTVYKSVDRSTPALMSALINGEEFKKAIVTMMHRLFQGAKVILTLHNVRVVSYALQSEHGDANVTLLEEIELSFEKLRIDYQSRGEQVDVGGVSVGHTRTFEVDAERPDRKKT